MFSVGLKKKSLTYSSSGVALWILNGFKETLFFDYLLKKGNGYLLFKRKQEAQRNILKCTNPKIYREVKIESKLSVYSSYFFISFYFITPES